MDAHLVLVVHDGASHTVQYMEGVLGFNKFMDPNRFEADTVEFYKHPGELDFHPSLLVLTSHRSIRTRWSSQTSRFTSPPDSC